MTRATRTVTARKLVPILSGCLTAGCALVWHETESNPYPKSWPPLSGDVTAGTLINRSCPALSGQYANASIATSDGRTARLSELFQRMYTFSPPAGAVQLQVDQRPGLLSLTFHSA